MGDPNLIILAGGMSSRMKKETDENINVDEKLLKEAADKPKSMLSIGSNERPFLDYLIYNAKKAGYSDIVLLVNNKDTFFPGYIADKENDPLFAGLKFTRAIQPIPDGRTKPWGTADALYHALKAKPEWAGQKFTVVNSDNLYSVEVLKLLLDTQYPNAFIDYNRDGLKFPIERLEQFAVTRKNSEGFLTDIVEKPGKDVIESVKKDSGYIGVSMNIFRFSYDMIFTCVENVPITVERNEKELPRAIMMMLDENPNAMYAYKFSEHVPDLTSKADIEIMKEYLAAEYPELG